METSTHKTVSFHPVNYQGEAVEDEIRAAILEHKQKYTNVTRVWCSKKDRTEKFTIDGIEVVPKSGCPKGRVMVL